MIVWLPIIAFVIGTFCGFGVCALMISSEYPPTPKPGEKK